MCRVAKGTEVGVVGRDNGDAAPGRKQTVKLLHRPHDVAYVLDHMNGPDLPERAISKRKGERVQIRDYVGPGPWVSVNSNGARIFI